MVDELANKYHGTVLICGSAPCVFDDYKEAAINRPESQIIVINDSARIIFADFLTSIHCEKMAEFRAQSLNRNITTISGGIHDPTHDVDYWFEKCNSGGTSAGSAIKIARKMGFSEIILCGCPMNGGDGYFDSDPKPVKFLMQSRFGNCPPDHGAIKSHQNYLKQEMAKGDYSMVRSMSGWTAKLFGYPDFAEAA